ncbi:unnamed protein product [Closterium sp. NIES-65]|nr:unnamed protein product [Closterium sp. NIES-65]
MLPPRPSPHASLAPSCRLLSVPLARDLCMPSLASRARSAPCARVPPSVLLSWRLPPASYRLSLDPPRPSVRPHCTVGGPCTSRSSHLLISRRGRLSGDGDQASKCSLQSGLASAWSCCVPLAADRAALATLFPPLAPSHRAAAAVLPNAKRRRSTLPAPGARRAGGTCPRALLGGAAPSPPSGTAPPSPCRADSAPATLDGSSRARPAPAVQSSPCAALPRGGRLNRAIPAAGPLIPRPPPGSSLLALPPARFPHRPFLLFPPHSPLLSLPPCLTVSILLPRPPRPAPASLLELHCAASSLRERRYCRSLLVCETARQTPTTALSHRHVIRAPPGSGTPFRRGGFRPPRQVRVRSPGATHFDPRVRRVLRHSFAHRLLDRPSQQGPDRRGRRDGAAIAPWIAHALVTALGAPVPPPVGYTPYPSAARIDPSRSR